MTGIAIAFGQRLFIWVRRRSVYSLFCNQAQRANRSGACLARAHRAFQYIEASMCKLALLFVSLLVCGPVVSGKTLVFWQDGFPTVSSQPLSRDVLIKALDERGAAFAGLAELKDAATWKDVDLFVLPYGSAVPADAWASIMSYLRDGGDLLVLGGQALRVPVTVTADGKFTQGRPQDTYARELGFYHTYQVPVPSGSRFAWKFGYSFFPSLAIRARSFFTIEGRLEGLAYMVNPEGALVAAPVVVKDRTNVALPPEAMLGSRVVLLDFEPEPGYWESPDGLTLIHQAAQYARQGATAFWLEIPNSTAKPDEPIGTVVHLRNARRERLGQPQSGEVKVELLSGEKVLQSARVPCSGRKVDTEVSFHTTLQPGFYTVRGVYQDAGQPREFYQNALWIEDPRALTSGPALAVNGDFLTRDGKPFFPVGSNYFSTESNGWDFAGPRNAWIWERDFADMEKRGVNFVRTGVWMTHLRMVEPLTDMVTERFLRNLEAFLLCAHRHNIAVNFTFFAFVPHAGMRGFDQEAAPVRNPYIDPVAIRGEQDYVLSIVNRFAKVPGLCWDLINEPSFSNPDRLWKGNTPNNDPTELAAWHKWLEEKYHDSATLAAAWLVTPQQLGALDQVPLPTIEDLTQARYGDPNQVRALDYNHFAQDAFSDWAHTMVTAIRATGSAQLIDVGQDEGGVTDRVLNQFYATSGVSFTTNHTYWRDDGLLWDSVAAKSPGIPNIVGETGYQPVWNPDGTWRFDEFTGAPLLDRKWALGFAAGNSGVLTWDWDREVDFGILRSDGTTKLWADRLQGVAQFATKAAPHATILVPPQVAIVLPQSLQLSVFNATALEAQKTAVRALYHYARGEAYAVGEYQTSRLGNPKLIILPSPLVLDSAAWQDILAKVREGAVLLVTGPFDRDAHFHPTSRAQEVGLHYDTALLTIRESILQWPEGKARLTFSGDRTTFLDRAVFPGDATWAEKTVGKGKVLFAALPIELNDNLDAVGSVYRYAAKAAGVIPVYSAAVNDPGILICATQFPHATLYVVTSESTEQDVYFQDQRSSKEFKLKLGPGHAALLLISENGTTLASYNWPRPVD
jgi:hypothetical protein